MSTYKFIHFATAIANKSKIIVCARENLFIEKQHRAKRHRPPNQSTQAIIYRSAGHYFLASALLGD